MTETVIVFDFETTGLSPKQGARPTEVAAVVLEDNLIFKKADTHVYQKHGCPDFQTFTDFHPDFFKAFSRLFRKKKAPH